MTFQELFEAIDRIGSYLKDLLTFYLAPGAYLQSVAGETDGKTAARLVVYAVLFTLLEVSILSIAVPKMPTGTFFLAGVTVFEVVVGLLYVPAFLVVTKFVRSESPAKTALVYALTFRFAYFLVPILFYVSFLTTEDYGFALLRGVSVYLFLFTYYLMLPLTLAQGVRKRAAASAISVVTCLLIFSGLEAIFDLTTTSSNGAVERSILFDPIGAEYDRFKVPFGRDTALIRVLDEIQFLVRGKDSLTPTPRREVQQRLSTLQTYWRHADSTFRKTVDSADQSLKALSDSATFRTTKDLIALKRTALTHERDVLTAIDAYARRPTVRTYIPVLRSHALLMEAEATVSEHVAEYLIVRIKLIKLGLLTNRPLD